jgi:hypothetical protein
MEVTMLDEAEYSIAYKIYGNIIGNLSADSQQERRKQLADYYYNLTGEKDSNPNSILHHRIALYGSPCENCRKPYRTTKASFCAACGHKKG